MKSGVKETYTLEAGDATLNLEVRDSRAGTLLGRVVDRRETDSSTPQRVSGAGNAAEFERLFAVWAGIAVKGLEELKAASPMPESIKPGQRIAAPKK
jgi:hypothetical protein